MMPLCMDGLKEVLTQNKAGESSLETSCTCLQITAQTEQKYICLNRKETPGMT